MEKSFNEQENFAKQQNVAIEGEFKCPSCGANMAFDPTVNQLRCDYCGTVKDVVRDTNVQERDFADLSAHVFGSADQVKTISCSNCGATEILQKDAVALKCPFCDSPLVVDSEELNLVKPDSLVPFAFDGESAKQRCSQWLKKRFFAPKSFKNIFNLKIPQGVYYPIWTFDASTSTDYDGRLGKTYTTTRTDSKGNTRTETHVRWFNVHGTRHDAFDDIVVNASKHVDDKTMEKLQPFPKDKYVVYSNEYLAGYFANLYTVDPFNAFKTAEEKMRASIRQRIISSYNADREGYLNLFVSYISKSFKSMLVPIYMTSTKYKEKWYSQYINGATGKIVGKYPKSVGKILSVVLLGLGIVGALVYLIVRYGN